MKENYLKTELDKLLLQDHHFSAFLEKNSPDGICFRDLQHPENEWVSPEFWTLLGYEPGEKNHLAIERESLIAKDDLQFALGLAARHCVDPAHAYDLVSRYRHSDGSSVRLRCRGMAVRDRSGKPLRMLSTYTVLSAGLSAENGLIRYLDHLEALLGTRMSPLCGESGDSASSFKDHSSGADSWLGESHYLQMVESSIDGFCVIDRDGRLLYVNNAYCAMVGYNRYELLTMSITDLEERETAEQTKRRIHQAIESGSDRFESRHRAKNGRIIDVEVSTTYTPDHGGRFFAFVRDISTQKLFAQKLRRSEARMSSLIKAIPDLIWMKDTSGVYLSCNTRFEKFFGAKEEEIIGKSDYDFMSRDLADFFRSYDRIAIEKGQPNINEEEVIFKSDGHRELLETIKTPIPDEDGQIIGVLGIGRNITERKLKEQIQESKLRLIDFSVTHSNKELLRMFLDEAELLTGSTIGFFHYVEDDQQTISLQTWSTNTYNNMCTAEGEGLHYPISQAGVWVDCVREQKPVIHNDYESLPNKKGLPQGHAPIVRELVVPVLRSGRIKAILGVGNKDADYTDSDIDTVRQFADLCWETIESKRAAEALRESEGKYRSMMEAMNDAAYISSPDLRIEYLNPAMVARVGRDGVGEPCYNVINGLEEQCPWCAMEDIQKGLGKKKELKSPKDNHYYQVSSSPIIRGDGTISKMTIYTDISQIKEAEENLRQAQKMESIGSLASGIAHDFNNILSPIIGYSEMLLGDLPEGSPEHGFIRNIHTAGVRGNQLVKQILTFSRQSEQKKVPITIQKILNEVMRLCRSSIPANIRINQNIQQDCGYVEADPIQIHQIGMNLITNAYHAIEPGNGEITVALNELELCAEGLAGTPLGPGKYAVFTVSDTGRGIDPSIISKIFEPYFTTKEKGKGTGLGLAVVYGIVKEHGGEITAESEPGKGTTFRVYLPIPEKTGDAADEEVRNECPAGCERILLVDDEKPIAMLERLLLQRLGYQVTEKHSSLEALEEFRNNGSSYDLVISDVAMPHMTGDQLARKLLEIQPDVPILLCTGFSENINEEGAAQIGVKGFLRKPFTNMEIAQVVRMLLDGSARSQE